MSKKPEPSEAEPVARSRKPFLHWSTIVSALVALPLAVVTAQAARKWHGLSEKSSGLEAELAALSRRNVVLEKANDILQNHKFQVCNKSSDFLTVPWVSAVYHDGRQLKTFDSSRCPGWRAQTLSRGESKTFTSSSDVEGCNWSGAVMFYAMNFTRESDEYVKPYNVAGPWRGFDKDCFTVE